MNCVYYLQKRLEEAGIPHDLYSLNGDVRVKEAYCLRKRGIFWEVDLFERGRIFNMHRFLSCRKACDYFYDWIVKASGI